MFTTTFSLSGPEFANDKLRRHLNFYQILAAFTVAQQKFLATLGLDIVTLEPMGMGFDVKNIKDVDYGIHLYSGDEVEGSIIDLRVEKRFYIHFHMTLHKAGKMACAAKFMMLFLTSKGPTRLSSEIESKLKLS